MRWTETRDGNRRISLATLPVLALLGLYLLVWPPPDLGRLAGAIALGMAGVILLVVLTALQPNSDPGLAVPLSTGSSVALAALLTAFLVVSGEPAAAVGLSLVVVAAGVFILSVPALVVIALAVHVGFMMAVVHHGGDTAWLLAGAGLVLSVVLAGLAHHRQIRVLKATLRLADRERRHEVEMEKAFRRSRDAELNAKRLSESASAGIQAQREREALRGRMQSILDSAGEGIIGTDHQGRVVFVNEAAARLTGFPEGQLVRENLHELVHHSRADGSVYPASECPVREVLDRRRVREVEGEVFWHRDGSSFPVSYVASPLVEEGKVRGVVVVFQDVTERAELEKMKDELVSVVSHELRTPLTSIHGSLKLLSGTMKDALPKQGAKLIDMASRNTERLIRLVNDLLDLERLRAGRFEMAVSPVGTRELAVEAVQSLQGFAHSHDVRLVTAGEDVTIVADGHRVHQALVNLISNAVKFSPIGGTVRVSTEMDPDRVWFSVVDEGPGIPRDKQKQLFRRFSQLDVGDARDKGGSGLGLAITRGIVEAHGGHVGLVSEPGKGSTFYMMLPRENMETGEDIRGEDPNEVDVQ